MARRVTTRETTAGNTTDRDTVVESTADRRDVRASKAEQVIWFVLTVVLTLILIRFVLLLFGARTGVPFVDFWYSLTAPLIKPFAGMFGNLDTYNDYNGMRIELEALVAMLVYGLIGYLLVLAVRLIRRTPEERNEV